MLSSSLYGIPSLILISCIAMPAFPHIPVQYQRICVKVLLVSRYPLAYTDLNSGIITMQQIPIQD